MIRKLAVKLREHSGVTLVELMVTFTLMGMFMVAVTFMLMSALLMFTRMQATSNAVIVSDMLLDKIAGEIVAADVPNQQSDPAEAKGKYYLWLDEDTHWIAFCDKTGSPISIYASDGESGDEPTGKGQLYIKYYEMNNNVDMLLSEINWHFDSSVYMGYSIENLSFSRPDSSEDPEDKYPGVVRIDLKLKHSRTGFEYSTYRYAQNYNSNDKKYICIRNDDKPTEMPQKASDFTIKGEEQ